MNRVISALLLKVPGDRKRRAWESLCRKCGICCYEKSVFGDEVIIHLDSPCDFLDPASSRCTVYQNRFKRCPDCKGLNFFHLFFISYLPPECGYMQYAVKKGYRSAEGKRRIVYGHRNNARE